jgi:hypothetical protein
MKGKKKPNIRTELSAITSLCPRPSTLPSLKNYN